MKIMRNDHPKQNLRELTLRGMILGALITFVFTASNVYLGLKVGLSFSTSIPAAVISMAVLRFFQGSNILEHNIVQTQASAAGCLSAVIFLLPAMLMLGYWQGFPILETILLCAAGGCLGVVFTVPLRHVLVRNSDLPYPEGLAAAEILKSGAESEAERAEDGRPSMPKKSTAQGSGKEIVLGGMVSGLVALVTGGFRVLSDSFSYWFKAGSALFQVPMGFSLALLGAGYLIGTAAGIALLVGNLIAWGVAVPVISAYLTDPALTASIQDAGTQIWTHKVRFIGVGTIAVASIWTLITLFKPMIQGLKQTFASISHHAEPSDGQRDLAPGTLIALTALLSLIIGGILFAFASQMAISSGMQILLAVVCTALVVLLGFLVAAACGYMAGLIGTSSSPISGIGIIALLVIAMSLFLIGKASGINDIQGGKSFLTALTILSVSILICIAAISNDNLQDLKTGQLVGASPIKQQVALLIGCLAGAAVIAPVLNLLYDAYGFAGAMPREGMDPAAALAAPQATLMSTLASGIFSDSLDWSYISVGAALCVIVILIDALLRKGSGSRLALPPLAVGMGIYLPPTVNMPMVAGALLSWLVVRHLRRHAQTKGLDEAALQSQAKSRATLFAAGLIVGESLMGVLLAFVIVGSVTSGGSDAPLKLVGENWQLASLLGLAVFVFSILMFARRILRCKRSVR